MLLWFLLSAGTARAQARPGEVLIGEDDDNRYYMRIDQYQGSLTEKLAIEFCRTRKIVAADQRAISELGFALDAERLDAFAKMSREQKRELEHTLFDTLLGSSLDAADPLLDRAKSLNPYNVNRAINMLKNKHADNIFLVAALRRIARQKDKPAIVAAYQHFRDVVGRAKEGWQTGSDAAKDPDNANLHLLVGALKTMQGSSELGLAISGAEAGESLAYLAYGSNKVNELARVSDEKLAHLADLSTRLKRHVDDMAASKRAWQKATGHTVATPICNP